MYMPPLSTSGGLPWRIARLDQIPAFGNTRIMAYTMRRCEQDQSGWPCFQSALSSVAGQIEEIADADDNEGPWTVSGTIRGRCRAVQFTGIDLQMGGRS